MPLILHPKVGQRLLLQRLLLSLHDIRQSSIPRLVQPQIRSDHHGQGRPQGLDTTIHLMGDLDGTLVILNIDLTSLGNLRPTQQTRQHLASLGLVAVNGLLAEHDHVDILLLDDTLQHLSHGERLHARGVILGDVDVERAVGAHGHGGAERVAAFGSAGGQREDVFDLQGTLAFAETDCFFDGELVEGVHRVLDARGLDAGLGFVDSRFDLLDG